MSGATSTILDGLRHRAARELTKQILDPSRITKTDAATNVANLTRLYGDWSIATDDQVASNHKLFRTAQATGIGVDVLSAKVVAFGAPMRALGMDFDTAIALLGKWEQDGVNVETCLQACAWPWPTSPRLASTHGEGLPALIEQIQGADDATRLLTAKQIVGQRAANDFFPAVKEGRLTSKRWSARSRMAPIRSRSRPAHQDARRRLPQAQELGRRDGRTDREGSRWHRRRDGQPLADSIVSRSSDVA